MGSAPRGQARVHTTTALLIGRWGLCRETARSAQGPGHSLPTRPQAPTHHRGSPTSCTLGEDQGAGGGHRTSRTLCKVGHGGTCGDAQGRWQRVRGRAAILRTGFWGTMGHRAKGCMQLLLLGVALGGERDRIREEVRAAGHSLRLLLGWR